MSLVYILLCVHQLKGVLASMSSLLTFTRFSTWCKHPIVMVAISALTVVPSGQVNAIGTAVTLNKAVRALIDVCLTKETKAGFYAVVLSS